MSTPTPSQTPPRSARVGRRRAADGASGNATSRVESLEHGAGHAQNAALIEAIDASAATPAVTPEEEQRLRTRQLATIVAAVLLVSAIVTGVAVTLARRNAQQRVASGAQS